jgi:hypothetical protein
VELKLGPQNECAEADQQQLKAANPSSRQRGLYTKDCDSRCSIEKKKKKSDRESQRAWRQDELIG